MKEIVKKDKQSDEVQIKFKKVIKFNVMQKGFSIWVRGFV